MKQTFHLSGMHCKSCEILLTDKIEEISGCSVEDISFKKGTVSVAYPSHDIEKHILNAITSCEYVPLKHGDQATIVPIQRTSILGRLSLSGLLLFIFLSTDVNKLIPNYDNLGFGVAFLVGLVASVSTCLAVTGGIIIGYTDAIENKQHGRITQLKFHAGRIVTFLMAGILLGAIGSTLNMSISLNAILNIVVGLVLAYLGAQTLGLVPNIARRGFHLPSGLTKHINKLKNPKHSPIVGAMTILLPCGFTQSMILFALQSQNPRQGAIVMGGFALGTLPVLLAIGVGTNYIKNKLTLFNPLIASLLIVFGLFTITNGFTLFFALRSSSTVNIQPEASISSTTASDTNSASQQLPIENISRSHNGSSFEPQRLQLPTGKNYAITVNPTSNGLGCMYEVVLPGQGKQKIIKDQPFVIQVRADTPKTITFVCSSMGMEQGRIIIN